jgi:hypothetical protein
MRTAAACDKQLLAPGIQLSGGSKAQLQMYGKTRFSSFAILIESLQRQHQIIERAVKSPAYVLAARKALKCGGGGGGGGGEEDKTRWAG